MCETALQSHPIYHSALPFVSCTSCPRDNRGYCYYLPPDEAGAIAQLDLSDDVVVAQLFANGMWQQLIEPLEVEGEAGAKPSQLQLSPQDFRAVFTLVEGGQVLPEQPILDDEDNQGDE